MSDTPKFVQEKMIFLYMNLSYEERLRKCASLFSSAKRIVYAATKTASPHLSGVNLDLAVFRVLYKKELSEKFIAGFEQHLRSIRKIQ